MGRRRDPVRAEQYASFYSKWKGWSGELEALVDLIKTKQQSSTTINAY
ncbi:hypothetical protein [Bremerella sp. P1]|nr:hypothetical protein [Bremerella sp. P1]WDI41759.1 hypothetical protein PSR63_25205 [Bremerella sp. P1]